MSTQFLSLRKHARCRVPIEPRAAEAYKVRDKDIFCAIKTLMKIAEIPREILMMALAA
jgi:hypothetical protein